MPSHILGLTPLISVFDMPKAIEFYCGKIGFHLISSSPEIEAPEGRYFHWAWLKLGDADLMLNTAYDAGGRPTSPDARRWAAHGDTCLYIGCSDVDQVYAELVGKGLKLKPPTNAPYGMRQLYLRDPDGYQVCFQHPVRS